MWTPSGAELLIILVVALLVFGPKKLPEMGKAIGSAVTEFKKGLANVDPTKPMNTEAKQVPPATESTEKNNENAG